MFAIVLVQPEIPPNTGNVIRLTANTATDLHLVEPLGFRMDDRDLRRAGLDYHEYARVVVHADFWFAFTTQASRSAYDVSYLPGDVLVFGSETRGLPPSIIAGFPADRQVRIPMREGVRSLNLSNAVAVAVYEAWRQSGFRYQMTGVSDGAPETPGA